MLDSKIFVVYRKYGRCVRRDKRRRYPDLGGIGEFQSREYLRGKSNIPIMNKIRAIAHLHGEHNTPLAEKHQCWGRASKRAETYWARFPFQKNWW